MTEIVTVNVKLSDFERCNADLDRLEAENKKLRDLVRDLYAAAWYEYPSAFEATYAKRLKELGIEVDV